MYLLLILLFQVPLRADRLPKTIQDEYALESPVFYIITDDGWESRLLKGNLQRDWMKYGRSDLAASINSLRIEKFVFIDWDDREAHRLHRINLEYHDFPRYRIGNVGKSVPYPKSTFSCNIWSIDVTSLLVDQYFFYEQIDEFNRDLRAYNLRYNHRCRSLIFEFLRKEFDDVHHYATPFQTIDIDVFLNEHPNFEFPEWTPPTPPKLTFPWEQMNE